MYSREPPGITYHWGRLATSSKPWLAKKRRKKLKGKARMSARVDDQMAAPMGRM